MKKIVRIKLINPDLKIRMPEYADSGSSGMDVFSTNLEPEILSPGEIKLFPLNFKMDIRAEENYEIQIRSKSGLALNHGVMVLNSPGTIDFSFRGEVGVILYNASKKPFTVLPKSKIAQMVLQQIDKIEIIDITKENIELTNSERGEGGFGSTKLV